MIHERGKSREYFDTGVNMGQEYQKRGVEEMQYVVGTQRIIRVEAPTSMISIRPGTWFLA